MKKCIKLFILLIGIIPVFVFATSTNISLACPNSAKPGETIDCTINAVTTNGTLTGLKTNYSFSSNVSFVSFDPSNTFSAFDNRNIGFAIGNTSGVTANVTVGILKVKINNNATTSETVGLTKFDLSDTLGASYTANDVNSTIRIKSTDNNLSNLTISGISFNFSPSITTYNLNTTLDNVTINATKNNNYSTMTGDIGKKSIKYGENVFKINITSEDGSVKTYTIKINRSDNRNTDTSLSNLTIEGINVKFNSTTSSYKFIVDNAMTSTQISATPNNKLSKVSGIGVKELKVGNNNFDLIVTAQNGGTRTYNITIIRKNENGETEALTDSTYLKNIVIKDYEFDFNKDTTSYNLTVDNNVEKLDISYELDSSSSTVKINNEKLIVGINTITIAVTSATNRTQLYTINVLRKSNRPEVNYNLNEIIDLLTTEDNIYVLIDNDENNKTIHKEIIEYLKSNDKVINYEIIDKNKNIIYSFKIDSNLIRSINKNDNLDVMFKINKLNDKYLKIYNNNNNLLYINTSSKISFDNIIVYKINVKNKYKNGDSLYLYINDKVSKKLSLKETGIKVKDDFIILKLSDINNYVLSDTLLKNNFSINYTIIIESIIILVLIIIIFKKSIKKLISKNKK